MPENIAVVGMTISHASGSDTSGGTFTPITPPSLKCKATNFMYKGTFAFSFAGGNSAWTNNGLGTILPATVLGTGTIDPTASKVKADGQFVIRENDTGSLTLFGTFVPNAPPNTPVPNTPLPSTDVEISDANQTKVSAE